MMMRPFELVRLSWLTSDREVVSGGDVVGLLRFNTWRRAGTIVVGAERYDVVSGGFFTGEFHMKAGEHSVCSASFEGIWKRRAALAYGGVTYLVLWPVWKSRVSLRRAGEEVGFVVPTSSFSRTATAQVEEAIPMLACTFIFWLIAYQQDRDKAIVAG